MHSEMIPPAEKLRAVTMGGYAATAAGPLANAPEPVLTTPALIRQERQRVLALLRRREITPPHAIAELRGLADQDSQLDRIEQRRLDRQGLAVGQRVALALSPAFAALAAIAKAREPRPVTGAAVRVLEGRTE